MNYLKLNAAAAFIVVLFTASIYSQSTAFTFQGRLTDNNLPANGSYEMQYALFNTLSDGSQIGPAIALTAVQVTNGTFTVPLDFGENSFDGSPRFLQITVGAVPLSPRQAITSAPYAVRSLKAVTAETASDSAKLGGIDANQYVTGQVVRTVNNMSSDVTITAGPNITITPAGNTLTIASTGGAGIMNQTALQPGANFNIGGSGSAAILNASTQFNIANNRILSTSGTDNLFIGINSGLNNTGFSNTFVARSAGTANTSGNFNSFFGNLAGASTTTGSNNTFVGRNAGAFNSGGSNNTAVGSLANVASNNLTFATAIGAGAAATESNSIVLGRSSGADTVHIPGDISLDGSMSVDGVLVLRLDNQGSVPICAVTLPNSQFFTLSRCAGNLQEQVEAQRVQIAEQQKVIGSLKVFVCEARPNAAVCR